MPNVAALQLPTLGPKSSESLTKGLPFARAEIELQGALALWPLQFSSSLVQSLLSATFAKTKAEISS